MSAKTVIQRESAAKDVETIIDHYLEVAGSPVALNFVDALESAILHVSHHPATGSSKYAHELDIPGFRSWPLSRFPYLIFYFEKASEVEIWRVLHDMIDLPRHLEH